MRIQSSGLPQTQQQGDYTIQQGDTLVSLASKFRTTPEALAKANNLPPDAALPPGQQMTIPKQGMTQMVENPTTKGIASVRDQFESVKSTLDPLIKQIPPFMKK